MALTSAIHASFVVSTYTRSLIVSGQLSVCYYWYPKTGIVVDTMVGKGLMARGVEEVRVERAIPNRVEALFVEAGGCGRDLDDHVQWY